MMYQNLENLTNEDEPFYNEIAGALDFFDKNIEAMGKCTINQLLIWQILILKI